MAACRREHIYGDANALVKIPENSIRAAGSSEVDLTRESDMVCEKLRVQPN